jgi:hypothetical protein
MAGQAASQKQDDLRHRGEEIRHKADYAQMSAHGDAGGGEASNSNTDPIANGKGFFTGILITLRLRPAKVAK